MGAAGTERRRPLGQGCSGLDDYVPGTTSPSRRESGPRLRLGTSPVETIAGVIRGVHLILPFPSRACHPPWGGARPIVPAARAVLGRCCTPVQCAARPRADAGRGRTSPAGATEGARVARVEMWRRGRLRVRSRGPPVQRTDLAASARLGARLEQPQARFQRDPQRVAWTPFVVPLMHAQRRALRARTVRRREVEAMANPRPRGNAGRETTSTRRARRKIQLFGSAPVHDERSRRTRSNSWLSISPLA